MVRKRCVLRLIVIVYLAAISAGTASACKCAGNYEGKNAWEVAKLNADRASVIFLGTPERFDIRWDIFNNKVGELISADSASSKPSRSSPGMLRHLSSPNWFQRQPHIGNPNQDRIWRRGLRRSFFNRTQLFGIRFWAECRRSGRQHV